ncbi:MAG: hypothetical protein WC511_00245 [Candidatus Pacearchaeota archaeon]|jgi:hypothetical protein
MTDRLDMIIETEEFLSNRNLPTREVPTLLIEDDPEKMLAYYKMTDVDYRHSEQCDLLAGGQL